MTDWRGTVNWRKRNRQGRLGATKALLQHGVSMGSRVIPQAKVQGY